MLRSRWATLVDWLLALVVLGLASAPDYDVGRLQGVPGLSLLMLAFFASRLFTASVQGSALDAYHTALVQMAGIISSLAGVRRGTTAPEVLKDPNRAIDALLRQAKVIAENAVHLPVGHRVTANLLLPDWRDGEVVGLRATHRDDFDPDRTHESIPLDAPGAGVAFSTGKPHVVAHTDDLRHDRIHGRPYKSIAAFPIIAGDPANSGIVVAVLSIDSTQPYTFENRMVERKLRPMIGPVAQLVGLVLQIRDEKEAEGGDHEL